MRRLDEARQVAAARLFAGEIGQKHLGADRPLRIGDRLDRGGKLLRLGVAVVDRREEALGRGEAVDGGEQRAGLGERRPHRRRRGAAMLAGEARQHVQHGSALRVVPRLDGEVAFGVGAHGAVVEVGGADPDAGGRRRSITLECTITSVSRPSCRTAGWTRRTRSPTPASRSVRMKRMRPFSMVALLEPGFVRLRPDDEDFQRGLLAGGAWPGAAPIFAQVRNWFSM